MCVGGKCPVVGNVVLWSDHGRGGMRMNGLREKRQHDEDSYISDTSSSFDPPEPHFVAPDTLMSPSPQQGARVQDIVDCETVNESTSLYTVGLRLSDMLPHVVEDVVDARDASNRSRRAAFTVGDILLGIDEFPVELAKPEIVKKLLTGIKDSLVKLVFQRPDKSCYDVVIKRNIEVETHEEQKCLYEFADRSNSDIALDRSALAILQVSVKSLDFFFESGSLQDIRNSICDVHEKPLDLISRSFMTETTLAFRIGVEKAGDGTIRSCTVTSVVPGSVADLCHGLQVGDLIHAVEDASVKSMGEDELIERMYGDGRVGSKCRLTVQSSRSGEIRDVEVRRTNASAASEMEDFFLLARDHSQLIFDGVDSVDLEYSLRLLLNQAINIERLRVINEQLLSARLTNLQLKLFHCHEELIKRMKPAKLERFENDEMTLQANSQGSLVSQQKKTTHTEHDEALLDKEIAHNVNQLLANGLGKERLIEILKSIAEYPRSRTEEVLRLLRFGKGAGDVSDQLQPRMTSTDLKDLQDAEKYFSLELDAREKENQGLRAELEETYQHRAVLIHELKELREFKTKNEEAPHTSPASGPSLPAAPPPPAAVAPSPAPSAAPSAAPPLVSPAVPALPGTPAPLQVMLHAFAAPSIARVDAQQDGERNVDGATREGDKKPAQTPHADQPAHAPSSRDRESASAMGGRKTAGVGMLLEKHEATGKVFVKKIHSGGSVEGDGRIRVMDRLLKVNEQVVDDMSLAEVLELVKGEEGTEVSLEIAQKVVRGGSVEEEVCESSHVAEI
ncbi:hypothetical protein GUITHDRAFT_112525 [Guillardia theta CCMP2712]|uniref:PDZ domain-containing protein n=1 Tax=Guillardia theta (strain CCMP2712) TaxID=905079 RepID=L1IZK5_GUITC|nr:hypothetical protein GUITHDRAFT_112525 [Guillardia theta CCMP2712]EKX41314.1 hypothetical protein GUITHDRAFT_112525 [Guillardia theta CCMP2712]|eukprot:XP_005828294.1 hypothetical protein GUITHDRAFT_112525 [Guillardia theta CCMP2712]